MNFSQDKKLVIKYWNNLPLNTNIKARFDDIYAYDQILMESITKKILNGLKENKIKIVTPKRLEQLSEDSIIKIMNKSWKIFRNNPSQFRNWEIEVIKKLKSINSN